MSVPLCRPVGQHLEQVEGPVAALRGSVRLLATRHMALLSLTFLYSGLLQNIMGLFGTCVGLSTE